MADLAVELGGCASGFTPGAVARGWTTDSNAVRPGELFLAIAGARVDGHRFVPEALAAGAVGAVVEHPVEGPHVLVPNLVAALARLAESRRRSFGGPVIGITGSAGKTTAKEFTAAALAPLGPVLKTEGNRNTEYTAPLLWAELRPEHRVAVVELAMRGFGQIAHLASFSRLTIGVVTNVGHAHLEAVGSREGIARAKGELLQALPPDGVAVVWQEDQYLEALRGQAGPVLVKTFGTSPQSDCRITRYQALDWDQCALEGTLDGVAWEARLPVVGRHIALSAAAALLAANAAGASIEEAASGLSRAQLPPLRMEIRRLNGATILLDTYNASPASMLAALETLSELPVAGRRLAVVGEMRELGEGSVEAHRAVGRALAAHELDGVLFVGTSTDAAKEEATALGLDATLLATAGSLAEVTAFLEGAREGDVVLVKGSRALELERALEEVAPA